MSVKQKRSAGSVLLKILIFLLIAAVVLAGGAYAYLRYLMRGVQTNELSATNEELGVVSQKNETDYQHYLLFGVDSRNHDDSGRSDVMIILTLDRVHHKVKMSSLARDTRVKVDGYGYTKLGHAYAYGGPELAIRTINQSFKMNISDYVTVNFDQMAGIIDAVGGVMVNVSEEEKDVFNQMFAKGDVPAITETGNIRLTGAQAVGYSRNRTIGTDVARQSRQREVLVALYHEIRAKSFLEYPALIESFFSYCETSIKPDQVLGLGLWAIASPPTFEEFALPNDACDAYGGLMDDGLWYFSYDLDVASEELHKFIYEE
ncbi:MAG: LCP family protein [Firmicutes bacterium]|nr:LCP family protein [Bacillota bacterium]